MYAMGKDYKEVIIYCTDMYGACTSKAERKRSTSLYVCVHVRVQYKILIGHYTKLNNSKVYLSSILKHLIQFSESLSNHLIIYNAGRDIIQRYMYMSVDIL